MAINGQAINTAGINAAGGPRAVLETVRETAVVLGVHFLGDQVDYTETAVIVGRGWPYPYREDILESGVIVGDYVPPLIRSFTVTDTAGITATATVSRATLPSIRDGFVGRDSTYSLTVRTENVLDSAVIVGDAASDTSDIDVRDTAVVVSTAATQLAARYTVRDGLLGSDAAYPAAGLTITDALVAESTSTPYRIARYVVRDTSLITGTDANDLPQGLVVDIRDPAVVTGYTTDRLSARLDVSETAYLSDRFLSSQGLVGTDDLPMDTVWTASVASWGMSRHSGGGITQRGTRFAVSPSGLYEIGATYSSAEIDTGFMSLGSKALKHVTHVYLRGSRDEDMSVTVTADRNGARASNTYTPIARDQSDSRTVRADIGRGYRSTYYKLQIATTGRAELFDGGVLVAATQRRI